MQNHHRYDNGNKDVMCTIMRPRDRVSSLVKYLPCFFSYALNISTVQSLLAEGKTAHALTAACGTLGWMAFVGICAYIQPVFTLLTLVYAFVEGNLLLAVVQIGWHAFVDEDDPTNDYINSTTIIEGENFTLNEECVDAFVFPVHPSIHPKGCRGVALTQRGSRCPTPCIRLSRFAWSCPRP